MEYFFLLITFSCIFRFEDKVKDKADKRIKLHDEL